MSATPSTMLELGTMLPPFRLRDLDGKVATSNDFGSAKGLLVAFICPHCPFVRHIRAEFAKAAEDFQRRGVAVIAINSNDVTAFPDDDPAGMRKEAREVGYTFRYFFDDTQEVAQAFRAACTPDFFLFDSGGRLVYRGQFDDSRPKSEIPVTGRDLRAAVDALLAGTPISPTQQPSLGCNIKWMRGNEPAYFKR
jgi:thiol-disulfide isomerase/thioredoxin